MINWKVRFASREFWLEGLSALMLLVQAVLAAFGVQYDLGDLGNRLLAVVNAAFGLLAVLGVVVDPTTHGIGDSARALGYEEPWRDGEV